MNQPTIHYPRSIEDTKRENCRRWARLKASLSLLRKVPGNPLCWRGGGTPRTLAEATDPQGPRELSLLLIEKGEDWRRRLYFLC